MNRSPTAVFFFPLPSRGTPLLPVAACFFPFSRFRDTSSDNPLPGIDKKVIARVTLGRVGRRLSSIDSVDCSTKRKAWNGRYETGWKASPESSTTASLRQQREIEREGGRREKKVYARSAALSARSFFLRASHLHSRASSGHTAGVSPLWSLE